MRKTCLILGQMLILVIGFGFLNSAVAQKLQVHYGLSTDSEGSTMVHDESGNSYNGALLNGATIATYHGVPVIDLGPSNGYVDLGPQFGDVVSSLRDFSILVKLFIPEASNIANNGNFIWSFANSDNLLNDAKGGVFFSAKNTRYSISPTNYTKESGVQNRLEIPKGAWLTLIFVQKGGIGKIFINGQLLASGKIKMSPSELGTTPFNYIGRSCYSADDYLKNAKIADFRVYDAPLGIEQIESIYGIEINYNGTNVLAKFDFNNLQDLSGKYTGTLNNGAELVKYNNTSVLQLGKKNSYFDFGSSFGNIIAQLDSFSFSSNMYIPLSTNLKDNGNFVWTFANSTNMASDANGNIFLRAGDTRYTVSQKHWSGENSVKLNKDLPKGQWFNLTYAQYGDQGKIYINGELSAQGKITVKPKELGATSCNFLGRSCYMGDEYLNSAQYDNFIVYQGILKESEVKALCVDLESLNSVLDSIVLLKALEELEIPNASAIRSNLALPSLLSEGVKVNWSSSNPEFLSASGLVNRPGVGSDPVQVTLTATLKYKKVSNTKDVVLTVLPLYSDAESVKMDLETLSISGNIKNIRSKIKLPMNTIEGCEVTWKSSLPEYLSNKGDVVQFPKFGSGKRHVKLKATLTKGKEKATKTFEAWVAEEENRESYLFAYFTGNSTDGEQIRFAVSNDGFHYTPLNKGERIMSSDTISLKKGVRDPHILRGEDGETFYMVVTDMKSAEGWSSNRGMVLLKSNDLVNWTHSTVHFPSKWPNQWGNVLRVWAPQTIYDPAVGKYMVYFSLFTGDENCPYDRIYYCYANEDFTDLEGEPQLFFDRGTASIDGDIVFDESDGLYHMFFKNESLGGISQVTAKTLTPVDGTPGSQWSKATPPVQQTTKAVEGAGVFRLINSDKWVLMYDCYSSGHYQYSVTNDLKKFNFVRDDYKIHARHGTTIAISQEELDRLLAKWPVRVSTVEPQGAKNVKIKENGCDIDTKAKTIDIAVKNRTDLSGFDPMLYTSPGASVTPVGSQDFRAGNVTYTFTQNGATADYTVSVSVEANPVLPGFHADPDILYSEKTKRFYIYPTSDGYPGWGGYSFDVFSSPDLVNWTNEGTILDLSSNQVSWATGNAWAPCIEEKKMADGSYRYFFYFSGNAGSKKEIGVAVANDPTGPFIDSGRPMISKLPEGIGGQLIDGDVFTDPVSGKSFFYYGNGFMAVAELNDDMVSIKENTVKVLTPEGGTLKDYAYREAPYVIYRNGVYYFLWSVDDTGADNYHVAYGTSSSPTGPIEVAESPIVLIQDAENKIYGPAHNSVLKIPGKDEWYIVYHRINANYRNNGPGFHREVCIDRLEFNADGTIKPVRPTRKGVEPIGL